MLFLLSRCNLVHSTILWSETLFIHFYVALYLEQDSPEVHANAAETLSAITRYAPPGLAAKISSPRYSFIFFVSFSDFMCSKPKKNFLYAL